MELHCKKTFVFFKECLGQNGCQQIRNFVEAGGYYIGICAGAYFASEFIEFDLNGELEVLGERILKFFPGKAIGPLNNFKYNDNDNSSIAAKIKLLENGLNAYVYLNGGCYFEPWSDVCNKTKVIATYEHNLNSLTCRNKIAVVECLVGKGKCLLSGVHFEFDARHLDSTNENVRSNILEKLLEANETTFSILSSDKNDKNHSNQKLVQYLLRTTFNI